MLIDSSNRIFMFFLRPVVTRSLGMRNLAQTRSPAWPPARRKRPAVPVPPYRRMVTSSDRVKAWFELAASSMCESNWKVATRIPNASLSHRRCPWNGNGHQMIKFDLRNIFVNEAPEKPCELFVRRRICFFAFCRHHSFFIRPQS